MKDKRLREIAVKKIDKEEEKGNVITEELNHKKITIIINK